MTKYIYDRFEFTEKYRNELIELIKHQTNIEIGGYRLFDGARTQANSLFHCPNSKGRENVEVNLTASYNFKWEKIEKIKTDKKEEWYFLEIKI